MRVSCGIVLGEISTFLPRISEEESQHFCEELARAKRIYITGVGRSGLVVKAFGQRLMHLGFKVHLADEITAPAVTRGDLLVACSGTGKTLLPLYMARKARRIGARVAALTTSKRSPLGRIANMTVVIPTPLERGRRTRQPARSLFEQVLFLYLDAVVLAVMQRHGIPHKKLHRRHGNLE